MKESSNNIVFCVNAKYSRVLYITVSSILRNSKQDINFYVLYSSIDESYKSNLVKIVNFYTQAAFKVYFIKVDIESLLKNKLSNINLVKDWFGSYDVYTRLFLPELLSDYNLKKIISMDADIIALSNTDSLFVLSSKIETIGGCVDVMRPNSHYLNAGLLIININFLKDIHFSEKAIDIVQNKNIKLLFPEQDIFNMIIEDDYKQIFDKKFNRINCNINFNIEDIVILHYAGHKPWRFRKPWNHAKFLWLKEKYIAKAILNRGGVDKIENVNIMFFIIEKILIPFSLSMNFIYYFHYYLRQTAKYIKSFFKSKSNKINR